LNYNFDRAEEKDDAKIFIFSRVHVDKFVVYESDKDYYENFGNDVHIPVTGLLEITFKDNKWNAVKSNDRESQFKKNGYEQFIKLFKK
jgi:hypothetical protein